MDILHIIFILLSPLCTRSQYDIAFRELSRSKYSRPTSFSRTVAVKGRKIITTMQRYLLTARVSPPPSIHVSLGKSGRGAPRGHDPAAGDATGERKPEININRALITRVPEVFNYVMDRGTRWRPGGGRCWLRRGKRKQLREERVPLSVCMYSNNDDK